jgi:hypothetical protein
VEAGEKAAYNGSWGKRRKRRKRGGWKGTKVDISKIKFGCVEFVYI